MNPRSLLAQHLPTLTEVVDEASIGAFPVSRAMRETQDAAPTIDLSDANFVDHDPSYAPTLTDHDIRRALAEAAVAPPPEAQTIDLPIGDSDQLELSERVLIDVQRQVEALLESRLREALAPLLAQTADALATQAREVLASSLRDLVSQAVAHEIRRQRGR